MRNDFDRGAIVELARLSTLRLLEQESDHPALLAATDQASDTRSRSSSLQ
jgi:hypothetical protein